MGKMHVVHNSLLIYPDGINKANSHEDQPWISLLTCEDFNADTSTYSGRRLVRAVLVDVRAE